MKYLLLLLFCVSCTLHTAPDKVEVKMPDTPASPTPEPAPVEPAPAQPAEPEPAPNPTPSSCEINVAWQRPLVRRNGQPIAPQEISAYYVAYRPEAESYFNVRQVIANVGAKHITSTKFTFKKEGTYCFQVGAFDIYGIQGIITPVFCEECGQ